METRSEQIRLTPTTKDRLERFREQELDSYAPLGEAVKSLLEEVATND